MIVPVEVSSLIPEASLIAELMAFAAEPVQRNAWRVQALAVVSIVADPATLAGQTNVCPPLPSWQISKAISCADVAAVAVRVEDVTFPVSVIVKYCRAVLAVTVNVGVAEYVTVVFSIPPTTAVPIACVVVHVFAPSSSGTVFPLVPVFFALAVPSVAPFTLATLGFGYVPLRSPPAFPVGAPPPPPLGGTYCASHAAAIINAIAIILMFGSVLRVAHADFVAVRSQIPDIR